MKLLAWVVGEGGLLGRHVARALERRGGCLWRPKGSMPWTDPPALADALGGAADRFVGAASSGGGPWALLWCAGAGVVGTPAGALEAECAAWEHLLASLNPALAAHVSIPSGVVFIASSAGGLYAGSPDLPMTEDSPTKPISDYGRAKERQEQALRVWGERWPRVATLIGRFSNVYGPGQRLDKPQGLISQIARGLLLGYPVHLWVPLDTIRDYIYVEDAADGVARDVEALNGSAARGESARRMVRIYASEQETTVGGVIAAFRLVVKRPVRVVRRRLVQSAQQPACLKFRSSASRGEDSPRTPLLVGIDRVWHDHLGRHQSGHLTATAALPGPPPPSSRGR